MARWSFFLLLAALVAANLAYPLMQAATTGGVVYYVNGNDEPVYLQSEFARAKASPLRPGQYLVIALHALGVSGGWQNVLFDLLTPLLLAAGLLAIFRQLGWAPAAARRGAIAALTLPLLASGANPLLHSLAYRNFTWGSYYWVNMVDLRYNPLMRSPEPQVSWLVVVLGLAVALRLRSAWPLIAVTPFTYVFVGIPVAFVAGSWELRRWWGDRPGSTWGPLGVTWLGIGAACTVFFRVLADPQREVLLTPTHLPLLSLSTVFALAAYAWLRAGIPPELRFVALAAALAPLAAGNQQVLSGVQAQAFNFEMFAGCFAVAAVLLLGAQARPRPLALLTAAGVVLWCGHATVMARENQRVNGQLPFDARLAEALRTDAAHVAVNEQFLAAALNLAYANQPQTALSFYRGSLPDRYIGEYRCARARVLRDRPADAGFAATLFQIDAIFAWGGQTYLQLHHGRKTTQIYLLDPAGPCEAADDAPLRYFEVAPAR